MSAPLLYRGDGSFALALAVEFALSLLGALLGGATSLLAFAPPRLTGHPAPAAQPPRAPIRLGIILHKCERGPNLPLTPTRLPKSSS